MAGKLIEIDGSVLEGGGQILRNAISLSVLTQTPIKIINIRAGRSVPGLREQHLKGILLAGYFCDAAHSGCQIGSTSVTFRPLSKLKKGFYQCKARTAGSISLIFQMALPCALFGSGQVVIKIGGGTNTDMAPQIDYITDVFQPNLRKFGGDFSCEIIKRGFFPVGGGEVLFRVNPILQLNPIELMDPGTITSIVGYRIASRGSNAINIGVTNVMKDRVDIYNRNIDDHNCAGLVLKAETSTGCILGSSALFNPKKQPNLRIIGKQAAENLQKTLSEKCCVDSYCQDQLIIFMALASGKSSVRVRSLTLHTKTAIHIAELMTKAKFNVKPQNGHFILECQGIGFKNMNGLVASNFF